MNYHPKRLNGKRGGAALARTRKSHHKKNKEEKETMKQLQGESVLEEMISQNYQVSFKNVCVYM